MVNELCCPWNGLGENLHIVVAGPLILCCKGYGHGTDLQTLILAGLCTYITLYLLLAISLCDKHLLVSHAHSGTTKTIF